MSPKHSLILELNRRIMQWEYKVSQELRNDYPKEVKKFKNEIGFYEGLEGVVRVFKGSQSSRVVRQELTKSKTRGLAEWTP